MSAFVAHFHENSPFFCSVSRFACALGWQQWPDTDTYYARLNQLEAPVHFVADSGEQNYELGIANSGQVPTRYANWHDYFNALCWCAYPRTKQVFNQLHRAHWRDDVRTRPRDGLTLLDESGVVVGSDDDVTLDRIRRMAWPELFVEHRDWTRQHLRVMVIGHGLLEKCLQPYIGMTAHAYLLSCSVDEMSLVDDDWLTLIDQRVCAQLTSTGSLSPAQLFPLPLLGLPGWWRANESPEFYDNAHYFRRSRHRQTPT